MKEHKFNGPYGNYAAGTMGATMNALCGQERLPTTFVDNLRFGVEDITKHSTDEVIAKYKWFGSHIFFEWFNGYNPSKWMVEPGSGIHIFRQYLSLADGKPCMKVSLDAMPFEDGTQCYQALKRWYSVRLKNDSYLKLVESDDGESFIVTIPNEQDIDRAIDHLKYCDGFKYQDGDDLRAQLNSYHETEKEMANKLFKTFSAKLNGFPNENYCSEFAYLSMNHQISWLQVARQVQMEFMDNNILADKE